MRDDAELVVAAQSGEREAFGPLVERWFDRCWEVAWRILHDRDLAADVAQDTLLTAWQQLDRLQRPASFGGWILRIARNRALDRLARERRAVPTADYEDLEPSVSAHDATGPEAAFARAQERDLVWAAAAALGERDASLLDLHLRHGLEPNELAEELGIAPNAAHQALFRLRRRLGAAVRAWLLWRDDAPACVVLRAELAAAGDPAFGATTVRTIQRHVRACQACAEEHDRVAAPAALFTAVPLVAAPMALRTRAVRWLAQAGVPTGDGAGPGAGGDGGGPDTGGDGDGPGAGGAGDGGEPSPSAAPPVSHRLLTGIVVALVVLAALGGWGWWRGTAGPLVPAAAGDAAPDAELLVPPPSTPSPPTPATAPTPPSPAAAPTVTPPPAPPPPSAPRPSPTSSPSPAPVAPAPEISYLRALFIGGCPTTRMAQFELVWASEHAATATLTHEDGTAERVAVSGTELRCATDGTTFTLDVTGPGGAATRTVETVAPQ